jgi:DNA polymerase-3 subunit gamma/tau
MGYIALYRKYRPQVFEDVCGQDKVVKILKAMIEKDKISNGYLFCGDRGLGKTTLAKIFSKAVNCESDEKIPCNECPSCIAINEGRSMDVIELDAASNRGVDTVRDKIINKVNFKPHGKKLVFIIDECHMFTTEAWNALLKTLEEPPEYCVFIFCTTNPEKMPKTILSRVLRFDLKNMTNEDIVNRLKYIAKKEKIHITNDALFSIARYAKGGMRDSISALDQVSSFADKIDSKMVVDVLGLIDDDICFDILDSILSKDVSKSIEIVNSVVNAGKSIDDLFDGLSKLVRTLSKIQAGVNVGSGISNSDVSDNSIEKLLEYKDKFTINELVRFIKLLVDSEKEIKFSADKQLAFISMISSFNGYSDTNSNVDLSAVYQRLDKLEGMINNGDYSSNKEEIKSTVNNIKKLVGMEDVEVNDEEQSQEVKNIIKWGKGKIRKE